MDLDDGVVDIEQRVPAARAGRAAVRLVATKQPGQCGQREQEPGRDGVQLAHVPEGDARRNEPSVEGA